MTYDSELGGSEKSSDNATDTEEEPERAAAET